MTALDLEAIRKRAAAATQAPFELCDTTPGDVWGRSGTVYVGHLEMDDDADFLVHARTDIPALCDEVERLRAENAKLREAANAVLRDFTPEHLDLIGVSMAGSKLRDALADLALRGGKPTRSET